MQSNEQNEMLLGRLLSWFVLKGILYLNTDIYSNVGNMSIIYGIVEYKKEAWQETSEISMWKLINPFMTILSLMLFLFITLIRQQVRQRQQLICDRKS